MSNKKNEAIAQKVVDRILSMIECGSPLPWVKPWGEKSHVVTVQDGVKTVTHTPRNWNRKGTPYSGSNTWLPAGEYITYAQAVKEFGVDPETDKPLAYPRKGTKAFPVVYWNFFTKEETDPDTGEKVKKTIPFLKYYNVFRVSDMEIYDPETGEVTQMEPKNKPKPVTYTVPVLRVVNSPNGSDLNDTAEAVIADYIARAGNGFKMNREVSDRAFYSPAADFVTVPVREQFEAVTEFYSTIFHELGHSTGHKTRLNRFTGSAASAAFGSADYSREELVAETTAATIINALDMEEGNTFRNSAAYVKGWSEALRKDPMTFVTAATRAQAAVDLILGISNTSPAADEGDGEE